MNSDQQATPSLHHSLANKLLARHADRLPDLRDIHVILPDDIGSQAFRATLLQCLPADSRAILPPRCTDLRGLASQTNLASDSDVLHPAQRQLLFIDALQAFPTMFKAENMWQVADALLSLFDELWLHQLSPAADEDSWRQQVQQAYQVTKANRHLSFEADIIHTLWNAWQQQLEANRQLDPVQQYCLQLNQLATTWQSPSYCYLVSGFLYPVEQACIEQLQERELCETIDLYDVEESSPLLSNRRFIDSCFDNSRPLTERVTAVADTRPPPLTLYRTPQAEAEVGAILLQVKQWLHDNKRRIGIICEDRKQSRRLRSVLDQAGIMLQDKAGWSLATTSAATVVERWLECIELDFDQRPLLDLLKSKFIDLDRLASLEAIYRFERDIVRRENTASNLKRYRRQLQNRGKRLQQAGIWSQASQAEIDQLLTQLQVIAQPLVSLYHHKKPYPVSDYFAALQASLEQLGIDRPLLADAAGVEVMQQLQVLQQQALATGIRLKWKDFRYYLSSSLETALFRPAEAAARVSLMTLDQAEQYPFDACLIAAADRASYPGAPAGTPFFNQGVRASLGLTSWLQHQQLRLQNFCQQLYRDIPVVITATTASDGEPVASSPWVEALHQFYCQAFKASPLTTSYDGAMAQMASDKREALPQASPTRPQPGVITEDIPERLSTSGHQRLIDCPYRFLAADILQLQAADEIRTELQKADYGERIHLALQVFHTEVDNMPAPFRQTLTASNRQQAIDYLGEVSAVVFRRDIEDNVLHHSWLQRWQKQIPAYIDWQIKQNIDWQVMAAELRESRSISEQLALHGRLDRIDRQQDGLAIIDYKTGKAPQLDDVLDGEDVQLSSYSLLREDASEILYLELDKAGGKLGDKSRLQGDDLHTTREQVARRLQSMIEAIVAGAALPAWGDELTCEYCDFSGLCRRQYWIDSPDDGAATETSD